MTSLQVKPCFLSSQKFSQSHVCGPCPLGRSRVSRALFGKPDVGDSEALLKQEQKEKLNEFLQSKIVLHESSKEIIVAKKVDTSASRCRKSSERQKPYEKQTSITSFYNQRKNGGCDKRVTSETYLMQSANETILHPMQNDSEVENSSIISASDAITNESTVPSDHLSEHQTLFPQQQIALDTTSTTTDHSAELV